MTEEQRRQQILQARQQAAQQRSAVPAMSNEEAARIATAPNGLTQEQMIAAAMLGKLVQNNITDIKKAAVGGNLNITDVNMAQLMPSQLAKAAGMVPQQSQPPRPAPVQAQPIPQQYAQPSPQLFVPSAPQQPAPFVVAPEVQPELFTTTPQPYNDPNQMEFDLNKQTRYEDIINAIDKLQNSVNILTDKVNALADNNNKKKPKVTNGTQAG